ncbi:MAG: ATP-binding protein [Planctomycetes bacterium]|nr:ATP-binding protein [Planctomycetota bacterium]
MQLFKEPVKITGEVFEDREIPSDQALVTPLVVRLVHRLEAEGYVDDENRMKIKLCFDEAITNGVKHGNREDFSKMVRVRMFRDDQGWGVCVQDEGQGFRLEDIPLTNESPEESLWRENGRGLPLMSLYMDECTYYDGGRTLIMKHYFG